MAATQRTIRRISHRNGTDSYLLRHAVADRVSFSFYVGDDGMEALGGGRDNLSSLAEARELFLAAVASYEARIAR